MIEIRIEIFRNYHARKKEFQRLFKEFWKRHSDRKRQKSFDNNENVEFI